MSLMCGDVKVQCERFCELMNLYFCHVSLARYRKRVECRKKNDVVKWHKLPVYAIVVHGHYLFIRIIQIHFWAYFFRSTWILL